MTISRGASPEMGRKKKKRKPLPFWRKPMPSRLVLRVHPATGESVQWYDANLGFDVGGVMLSRFSQRGTPLPRERYKDNSPLYEGVREAFRLFVLLFGAKRIFIIKNDSPDGALARESWETLDRYDFTKRTGFLPANYLKTKNRTLKWKHCHRHKIDIYADDKAEVGRFLPRRTFFFWFGEEAQEDQQHVLAVFSRGRKGRLRYMQVQNWSRLTEEVLRFFPPIEEVLEGRPELEKDEVMGLLLALRRVGKQ